MAGHLSLDMICQYGCHILLSSLDFLPQYAFNLSVVMSFTVSEIFHVSFAMSFNVVEIFNMPFTIPFIRSLFVHPS